MEPQLVSTPGTLVAALAIIVFVLFLARRRGLAWHPDRGLGRCRPTARAAVLRILLWTAWMALGEVAISELGMARPTRWLECAPLVFGLRIVATGIAGPACEELLIRCVVFSGLGDTRLGTGGTIALTAAAWAAMHGLANRSSIWQSTHA